ncbi:MAG: hypothetical protein ABF876_12950 [Acetobacter aceti]|nr:hypothetical protein [Acetobacter aceti]
MSLKKGILDNPEHGRDAESTACGRYSGSGVSELDHLSHGKDLRNGAK